MELKWDVDTGWPSQLYTMKMRISALVRNSSHFKVGITSNPENRIHAYRGNRRNLYSEMIVVYKTQREENVRSMEKSLYDHYRERFEFEGKDGARKGPLGDPPYYLYVVRN